MLFNSIEFAIFLPIVFLLYWYVTNKNLKIQNGLILVSSYFFYGWWDWRFLSLIAFSSFVDYYVGVGLGKTDDSRKRKALLLASILVNLGFLGFFKYFNFFAESFSDAFTFFGSHIEPTRLNIILPVGISFYTFQTLSYSIDVYKGKLKPTKDITAFFAFVSFFPQLVAGPIERATNLLPQFYKKRQFDKRLAIDGLQQIVWGLLKKIVIADNCANFVNTIFADYQDYSGSTLLLGAIFFAFQIYCDFSGYSDIAIGTSKLFGFNLMRNFAFPYFSRDIAEFWRRWHISLSTWFRDYVYIPLGGSRGGLWMKIRNTFIIFVVSGFWHGANWTFVIWGALNALYFLPLLLAKRNRLNTNIVAEGKLICNLKEFFQMTLTFLLTVLAWVFFRSESVADAFNYLSIIISKSLFIKPSVLPLDFVIIIILFIMAEWFSRHKQHPLELAPVSTGGISISLKVLRTLGLTAMIWIIILWGAFDNKEFIYFQF
jgi:alginate O-acetyltransferase complex protein AlgI